MQVFKFNAGTCSVERAVADAIGQGLAARREHNESLPQRFAQLVARLDDTDSARSQNSHDTARLQSRKPKED